MEEIFTAEERRLTCFSGPGPYPKRLQWYLRQPEALARATRTGSIFLGSTKTFRRYLHRYIRSFQPERLLPEKDLWLDLSKKGVFFVRQGRQGQSVPCLSETDNLVFHYLCFLKLRQFWNEVRHWCRFPMSTYPLVIRDFSDRLDEQVDWGALMQRACVVEGKRILIKQRKREA